MTSRIGLDDCPFLTSATPDDDQHDRHDEPTEPDEPADERLDAAAERSGEVEVDRQAEQHADADQHDADELVLAAVDRLAQLGLRLRDADRVAVCARGAGASTVGASTDGGAGRATGPATSTTVATGGAARDGRCGFLRRHPRWSWRDPRYQRGVVARPAIAAVIGLDARRAHRPVAPRATVPGRSEEHQQHRRRPTLGHGGVVDDPARVGRPGSRSRRSSGRRARHGDASKIRSRIERRSRRR